MNDNKLIPELSVTDIEESKSFYQSMGFTIEYEREEDKFAMLSLQGSQIMLEEINEHWNTGTLERPFGRGMNLQIEVDDLGPILQRLKDKQYPLFKEPRENWYRKDDSLVGNKEFLVQDPDGYLLRFAQDLGTKRFTAS